MEPDGAVKCMVHLVVDSTESAIFMWDEAVDLEKPSHLRTGHVTGPAKKEE
jgi:hypothetical protein